MTTNKPVGREVHSLDALAKQRRDALPKPVDYELFGVEFTLPPVKSLPFEMQERVGDLNDSASVLKDVLGADKVREMYRAGYTFGDLELIAEEWQKMSGLEPGESLASTAS